MICLLYISSHFWLCEQGAARPGQLIIRAAREGQPIICLSALFAPVMACGPSSERELRRRPSYHLPFVSFARLYGEWPKRASLSLPFCAICPLMVRSPSAERALRRRPSYHLNFVSFAHLYGARPERASFSLPFCPILPRYGARPERASPSGPVCHLLLCLICGTPRSM